MIKDILRKEFGIKSNHIHNDQWTGVSLTRWLELFPTMNSNYYERDNSLPSPPPFLSSLWSVLLWERSRSKECLLDYMQYCDKYIIGNDAGTETQFFNFGTKNGSIHDILNDPVDKQHWLNDQFSLEDLSSDKVNEAMDRFVYYSKKLVPQHHSLTTEEDMEYATALEIVCASIALERYPLHGKPKSPNGYHGYDNGPRKADCAEVTVREILDLLLWNEQTGSFDMNRLPSTASDDLIKLYQSTTRAAAAGAYDADDDADDDDGDVWFELLSNIDGCDYLEESPNGKPYELAPTMSNLARALRRLLVGHPTRSTRNKDGEKNDNGNDKSDADDGKDWSSLHDLANIWQIPGNKLYVMENTLEHQARQQNPNKDDDDDDVVVVVRHEVATLQVENNPTSIELRMRCDFQERSGMSLVTHLRNREQQQHKQGQEKEGHTDFFEYVTSLENNDLLHQTLALSLVRDDTHQGMDDKDKSSPSTPSPPPIRKVLIDLMATPFGCDRRSIPIMNPPLLSGINGNVGDGDDKQQRQPKNVFLNRQQEIILSRSEESFVHELSKIHSIIQQQQPGQRLDHQNEHINHLVGALLSWVLLETPLVVEYSPSSSKVSTKTKKIIEEQILSFPNEILIQPNVQQSLCQSHNGIYYSSSSTSSSYGNVIAAYSRLRAGIDPPSDILFSTNMTSNQLGHVAALFFSR